MSLLAKTATNSLSGADIRLGCNNVILKYGNIILIYNTNMLIYNTNI